MANSLYILLIMIFLNIIILVCSIFDLRFRKIPNRFFIILYSLSGAILLITFLSTSYFVQDLLMRVKFIALTMIMVSFLYFLKIIGGGDGKLLILIYILLPLDYLTFKYFILFFLNFYIIFIVLIFLNFLKNIYKYYYSFDFIFNFHLIGSKIDNIYYLISYKFLDVSELGKYRGEKTQIKSLTIIFNNSNKRLQILAQLRQPLIIVFALSFNFVFLI